MDVFAPDTGFAAGPSGGGGLISSDIPRTTIGATSRYVYDANGVPHNPQFQRLATNLGLSAVAPYEGGVAIGAGSLAAANACTAVGYHARAAVYSSVALGDQSTADGFRAIAMGRASNATAPQAIAIGANSQANFINCCVVGTGAEASGRNQFVAGSNVAPYADVWFGGGSRVMDTVHPISAWTLHGEEQATFANKPGGALNLAGGRSTGTGIGGVVNIQTCDPGVAGSNLNPLVTRLSISGSAITFSLPTTVPSPFTVLGTTSGSILNLNASAGGRQITGQTNGVYRWRLVLGSGVAEGGGDTGSDFRLFACNDAGVDIDLPIQINRAAGSAINFARMTTISTVTVSDIAINISKPLGALSTSPTVRARAYSPSYELIDKDAVMNWYFGLNDNDADSCYIGKGYGPGQGIAPSIRIDTSDNITMRGTVTINNATNQHLLLTGPAATARAIFFLTAGVTRWQNSVDGAAESGGNQGSNWGLYAYSDAGAYLDTIMYCYRYSGGPIIFYRPLTVNANVTIANVSPHLFLNGSGSGQIRGIIGYSNGSFPRWYLQMCNATPETGGDAGSDLQLFAYSDAGAQIDAPLGIVRAAGGTMFINRPVNIAGNLTVSGTISSGAAVSSGTYVPTFADGGNTASVVAVAPFKWLRVGNVVHVAGLVNWGPTTGGVLAAFFLTLPIASNITNQGDIAGNTGQTRTDTQSHVIVGDAASDRAVAYAFGNTVDVMSVCFTYIVQ